MGTHRRKAHRTPQNQILLRLLGGHRVLDASSVMFQKEHEVHCFGNTRLTQVPANLPSASHSIYQLNHSDERENNGREMTPTSSFLFSSPSIPASGI